MNLSGLRAHGEIMKAHAICSHLCDQHLSALRRRRDATYLAFHAMSTQIKVSVARPRYSSKSPIERVNHLLLLPCRRPSLLYKVAQP